MKIRVEFDAPAPWQDTWVYDTGEIENVDAKHLLDGINTFILRALLEMGRLQVRE